ncbi:MAG: OmpA family protein [Flammeovirgaceae bacterium]|nr:OmpA family protein [Flammeovirgaceae bacterium]
MKTHFLNCFLIVLTISVTQALAQKPKKGFKKAGVIQLNDSLTTYSQSDIFEFPQVNKLIYYQNAEELKKITEFKNAGREQDEYTTLKQYVTNFGNENFYRNASMIWRLANLSEKYGPKGEAVLLYRLVLKHHRQDVDGKKVRLQYDTLTWLERDYYVPLKQYYELVEYRKEIDTLRPPHGVLLNMGPLVNSLKEDYAPTIGNVDSILLFTSKRNQHTQTFEKRFDEDLFFAHRAGEYWMEVTEFRTINTQYNEGSACLSADGKNLFFARCSSPDSQGNCDLFMAELKPDNTWGLIRNLGSTINTAAWDSHPTLSHTGDTLFFASDRIGGFGLADIYYSVKDVNGNWQKAVNLGPIINTRGNEVSPFFHHKFNVLYFSSDGQPINFGSFDIYKTYRQKSHWTEPKNIGPLVNGQGSEYYFTIDSESNSLYYARSEEHEIQNLDLHSFPVPMEAQPEAVVNLKGTLKDKKTGRPFQGIVSIIDLDEGVEVAPKFLRPDGSFDFNLINKRNYLLIIQGDDFFRIEHIFYLDGDQQLDLETEPIEAKLAFKSLEFESGKSDILPSMHQDLDRLANFLIDHPKFRLSISGHTDSQGRADANLRLSQERADAIKAYLVYTFKIESARISAIGYGGSRPIVKEEHDDHRQLNRRVEFELKKEDQQNK